jgi:hypothetical protein
MLEVILFLLLNAALLSWASPVVDFQVAQPPPLPSDVKQCTVNLFDHTFGNSFGMPALATLKYVLVVIESRPDLKHTT